MPKKVPTSQDMPMTRAARYEKPGSALGSGTAIPPSCEFDLKRGEHIVFDGDNEFSMKNWAQEWGPNEQTFTALKRGNKVTAGGNF